MAHLERASGTPHTVTPAPTRTVCIHNTLPLCCRPTKAPRNVTATLQQCSDTTYNAARATLQHRFAQEFEEQVRAIKQQRARHALWLQVHTHTPCACVRVYAHACERIRLRACPRARTCVLAWGPGRVVQSVGVTVRAYRHSRDHCSCCVGSTSGRHSGGLRHGKPRTATDDQVGCRAGVCGAPSIRDARSA